MAANPGGAGNLNVEERMISRGNRNCAILQAYTFVVHIQRAYTRRKRKFNVRAKGNNWRRRLGDAIGKDPGLYTCLVFSMCEYTFRESKTLSHATANFFFFLH